MMLLLRAASVSSTGGPPSPVSQCSLVEMLLSGAVAWLK